MLRNPFSMAHFTTYFSYKADIMKYLYAVKSWYQLGLVGFVVWVLSLYYTFYTKN